MHSENQRGSLQIKWYMNNADITSDDFIAAQESWFLDDDNYPLGRVEGDYGGKTVDDTVEKLNSVRKKIGMDMVELTR